MLTAVAIGCTPPGGPATPSTTPSGATAIPTPAPPAPTATGSVSPEQRLYSAIREANEAFAGRDFPTARRLYEQAASEPPAPTSGGEPGSDRAAGLRAFARFRLLLLHALLGEEDLARWVLEDMQQLDGGTGYARLGQFFWHTYGMTNDLEATCGQVAEQARSHPELLQPLTGYAGPELRAEDLCVVPKRD